MKIFGINFVTKRELRNELTKVRSTFPLDISQVVYDIQLKDDKGRFTKTNPSYEHSTISEVVVDEKNYFSLVERLEREDVFVEYDDACDYLEFICEE